MFKSKSAIILIALIVLINIIVLERPMAKPLKLSKGETHCLVLNVFHEARGESEKGWRGVFDVTLNRYYDSRWPNTICGVVFQANQFSWTDDEWNFHESRLLKERETYNRIKEKVQFWLKFSPQPKIMANHFIHKDYDSPWVSKMSFVSEVGSHRFYRG